MYHLGVIWVFFHIHVLIKSFYIIHENLIQSLFNRQNVLTKLELTTIFKLILGIVYFASNSQILRYLIYIYIYNIYLYEHIYKIHVQLYTQNDIQRNTYLKSLFKSHCRYRVINNRCIYIHPRLKNIHCFFLHHEHAR